MHKVERLAVDFFTVDTGWLQRLYVLFHRAGQPPRRPGRLDAASERHLGDQQGRPFADAIEACGTVPVLIRDRDQKLTTGFDDVFRSDGLNSSYADSCAAGERCGGTVRKDRACRVFGLATDRESTSLAADRQSACGPLQSSQAASSVGPRSAGPGASDADARMRLWRSCPPS